MYIKLNSINIYNDVAMYKKQQGYINEYLR
jgi:hypothetical protein